MIFSSHNKVYAKLISVSFIWGATYIAAKIVTTSIPPLVAATLRFFIAAILLVLVSYKYDKGLPKLNRNSALTTLGLGLSGIFLYNIFFFSALTKLEAGRSSLFVALSPAVTALAASFLYKERLGTKRWLGVLIAFLGALIVLTKGDLLSLFSDAQTSFGTGELMMMGAVVCWTLYTLIGRKASTSLSSIATTTYAVLWGLLFLTFFSLQDLISMDWSLLTFKIWAALIFMGAFATVLAFVWFLDGVRQIGASRTAVFNNLVPVFGVLLASSLIGETILASMVIGGAIGIFGVTLTNSPQKAKPVPSATLTESSP